MRITASAQEHQLITTNPKEIVEIKEKENITAVSQSTREQVERIKREIEAQRDADAKKVTPPSSGEVLKNPYPGLNEMQGKQPDYNQGTILLNNNQPVTES